MKPCLPNVLSPNSRIPIQPKRLILYQTYAVFDSTADTIILPITGYCSTFHPPAIETIRLNLNEKSPIIPTTETYEMATDGKSVTVFNVQLQYDVACLKQYVQGHLDHEIRLHCYYWLNAYLNELSHSIPITHQIDMTTIALSFDAVFAKTMNDMNNELAKGVLATRAECRTIICFPNTEGICYTRNNGFFVRGIEAAITEKLTLGSLIYHPFYGPGLLQFLLMEHKHSLIVIQSPEQKYLPLHQLLIAHKNVVQVEWSNAAHVFQYTGNKLPDSDTQIWYMTLDTYNILISTCEALIMQGLGISEFQRELLFTANGFPYELLDMLRPTCASFVTDFFHIHFDIDLFLVGRIYPAVRYRYSSFPTTTTWLCMKRKPYLQSDLPFDTTVNFDVVLPTIQFEMKTITGVQNEIRERHRFSSFDQSYLFVSTAAWFHEQGHIEKLSELSLLRSKYLNAFAHEQHQQVLGNAKSQCPICYEFKSCVDFIFPICGHFICTSCAIRYLKAKATVSTTLARGLFECPVCKYQQEELLCSIENEQTQIRLQLSSLLSDISESDHILIVTDLIPTNTVLTSSHNITIIHPIDVTTGIQLTLQYTSIILFMSFHYYRFKFLENLFDHHLETKRVLVLHDEFLRDELQNIVLRLRSARHTPISISSS